MREILESVVMFLFVTCYAYETYIIKKSLKRIEDKLDSWELDNDEDDSNDDGNEDSFAQ